MSYKAYLNVSKGILFNKLHRTTYPSFCTFIITWRCNLRCYMCDVWKKEKSEEMTTAQVQLALGQLKSIDFLRVTGGEPFLREDLSDIVKIVQKEIQPQIIHITTNGVLTARIVEFVRTVGAPNIHLKLSIDAVGEKHDEIRGKRNTYAKAYETLRELAELRQEYRFYLGVDQTITSRNMDQIDALREVCAKLGVNVHYAIASPHYTLYQEDTHLAGETGVEALTFDDFSEDQLRDIFARIGGETGSLVETMVQKYYLKGLENRLLRGIQSPKPRCVALYNHLRLLPDGNVTICVYDPTVVGNLVHQTIDEIWFGTSIERFRRKVDECAGCWAGCEVKPNAVYSGDIVSSLLEPLVPGLRASRP